ncbi:hypothetical protein FQN57_002136 [Myotisia sp. PD_48]|nr:hypothetical protein FQN57_002136 [Myotisia sp. PD_48]
MDSLAGIAGVEPEAFRLPSRSLLGYTQMLYPIILLVIFCISFIARTVVSAQKIQPNVPEGTGPGGRPLPQRMRSAAVVTTRKTFDFSPAAKLTFKWLSLGVLLTLVADAAVNMTHVILRRREQWWCGQSVVVYIVGSFFVYSLILVSLIDTTPAPSSAQLIPWAISVPLEALILALYLKIHVPQHREPVVGDPNGGRLRDGLTPWESVSTATAITRILLLASIVTLYVLGPNGRNSKEFTKGSTAETTGLLRPNQNGSVNGNNYGSGGHDAKDEDSQPTVDAWVRPKTIPSTSWWEYLSGYSLFFPYLWPSKSRRLQLTVLFCFVLLVLQRIVNIFVPYQIGEITNILARGKDENFYIPWGRICLYVVLRWLQGNQGLIGSLRSFLWIPVGQYSFRELSTAAFEHVHTLSLDFHLGKKTGEVLSALSKGNSINTFLEQVTFNMVPMLMDLLIAIGYFLIFFDVYYALVVTIVTFIYLYITIRMAQWRSTIRRQMVNADRQQDAVKNDSMVSYETVKYFNAEQYEFNRYRSAVNDFQAAENQVLFSLQLMNSAQNTVFVLGILITCFIAAYQVARGDRKVGQFVSLLTYMAQLQGPLNFFGTFYRSIQSALINSERMLELFREKPTVVDGPNTSEMTHCAGDIRFEGVDFSYDARKPALNGLSFHCKPGTTTALVGESGGGKSTVFRLLFRFYNAFTGTIRVDGQAVETVTIDSLRRHIGVVPQDTVLFNETLMYNLKYANPAATDEQVYAACRAASIHDKILTFPDGYNTNVGERGLRLSGGEKQRVAIARTILKNPRIILLDEATAALDTGTEEHIQEALASLAKGRTMLVIAHRLSTITTADQILVLADGEVAERGTHEELIAKKGKYAEMWRRQVKTQRAAARVLQDRAQRIRSSIEGDYSSSQSDEEARTYQPPRET